MGEASAPFAARHQPADARNTPIRCGTIDKPPVESLHSFRGGAESFQTTSPSLSPLTSPAINFTEAKSEYDDQMNVIASGRSATAACGQHCRAVTPPHVAASDALARGRTLPSPVPGFTSRNGVDPRQVRLDPRTGRASREPAYRTLLSSWIPQKSIQIPTGSPRLQLHTERVHSSEQPSTFAGRSSLELPASPTSELWKHHTALSPRQRQVYRIAGQSVPLKEASAQWDALLATLGASRTVDALSEEERRRVAERVFKDFVVVLATGVSLPQLTGTLDILPFLCMLTPDLTTLMIAQRDGTIVEFPLALLVRSVLQRRDRTAKERAWNARRAIVEQLMEQATEDGEDGEDLEGAGSGRRKAQIQPEPSGRDLEPDVVVFLDFTYRRLGFIFDSPDEAVRFQICLDILARWARSPRAPDKTAVACQCRLSALKPQPSPISFLTSMPELENRALLNFSTEDLPTGTLLVTPAVSPHRPLPRGLPPPPGRSRFGNLAETCDLRCAPSSSAIDLGRPWRELSPSPVSPSPHLHAGHLAPSSAEYRQVSPPAPAKSTRPPSLTCRQRTRKPSPERLAQGVGGLRGGSPTLTAAFDSALDSLVSSFRCVSGYSTADQPCPHRSLIEHPRRSSDDNTNGHSCSSSAFERMLCRIERGAHIHFEPLGAVTELERPGPGARRDLDGLTNSSPLAPASIKFDPKV